MNLIKLGKMGQVGIPQGWLRAGAKNERAGVHPESAARARGAANR